MPGSHADIPLVVLGGSDLRPPPLPRAAAGQHALGSYKGAAVRIGGRPLMERAVERFRAAGAFHPVLVAGPARIYAELPGVDAVVDTDGSLAENVRAALAHATPPVEPAQGRDPPAAVALATCDVLPDPDELARLVTNYRTGSGAPTPPALWYPLVRKPADPDRLGVHAWKPEYRVHLAASAPSIAFLPGHLVILEPTAVRVELALALADAAYATRNRPIPVRRRALLRRALGELLRADLRRIARGRLPAVTAGVLLHGLRAARGLRRGDIALPRLEEAVAAVLLHGRCRGRGVALPLVDAWSLAVDVDTEEEVADLDARWRASPPPAGDAAGADADESDQAASGSGRPARDASEAGPGNPHPPEDLVS